MTTTEGPSRLPASLGRSLGAVAAGLGAVGLLACGSGCYSRVVKESGIGRGADKVYEPNLKLPQDDDPWNFGTSAGGPGVKNWKAAGQKPKSKQASD